MRKRIEPEVFEFYDGETSFSTTDKELAVIVLGYCKKTAAENLETIKDALVSDLDEDIKRIKNEIKEDKAKGQK